MPGGVDLHALPRQAVADPARQRGTLRTGSRGCCTIEDSMDARRAANLLGIPFYVWDFSERFAEDVVDDFVAEYAAGRTPNPCLRCNEKIKFAALMEKALALGFDAVATYRLYYATKLAFASRTNDLRYDRELSNIPSLFPPIMRAVHRAAIAGGYDATAVATKPAPKPRKRKHQPQPSNRTS